MAKPTWLITSGGVRTAAAANTATIAYLRLVDSCCDVIRPTRPIRVSATGS